MFLQMLPPARRQRMLDRFPNLRKAAPPGTELVFDRYLGELRVNINTRFKVERIMWTGEFEPAMLKLLRRHVSGGAICLDIGANVGAVTLALARHVGDTGRVVALEPAPPTCARLRANLDLNPALKLRVTVLNQGAGETAGTLYWTEEADNPGNGSLGKAGNLAVLVTTVDAVVRAEKLARVDFMKVDVEGMERAVFAGARETLAAWHPMLYFETLARFQNASGGDNFSKIRALLASLGYDFFRINATGDLSPLGQGRLPDYTVAVSRAAGA